MHKGQFSNTHLANHQLYCLGRVGYRVFKKKSNMYFFYFFIINMFSFFSVFFHKLFPDWEEKGRTGRANARNATRDRPSRQSQPFSVGVNRPWQDGWMTGWMDRWMTGQIDEMMLHIPTSFTICNSIIE
jgi:hypothetical protein